MLIIFRGSDWQTLVFIGVFLGKSKVFLKMSGVFRGTDPGTDRDRRATSRLGGGGGTLVTQSWGAQDTFSY